MENSFADDLKAHGYTYSDLNRTWLRSGFSSIAYSDGDAVELRLQRVVDEAADLSIFSPELSAACIDWPSYYHLTSERANLLRPFEHSYHESPRVLEIGAGCGAITRYLGECGCQVLALEGSVRRAAIAASRTRDLANVTVVAERFDDFKTAQQYDIITLIGVLEYASIFTRDNPAALRMLERVAQLLAPGGRLIIAIENQLGLKYFAGMPEDHLGTPMSGIENRYPSVGPRTFGRAVLAALLSNAGLGQFTFMAPFPDYKTPTSILTQEGLVADDFDGAAFAWQSVMADVQMLKSPTFQPELVWPTVFQNKLAMELSNSFLIEACKGAERPSPVADVSSEIVLAYHFSTKRRSPFTRQTIFARTSEQVVVRSNLLFPTSEEPLTPVRHRLTERCDYVRGDVLALDIVRVLKTPEWSMFDLQDSIRRYVDSLHDLLVSENWVLDESDINCELPAWAIDALPRNLIRNNEGVIHYIDREWELTGYALTFGHLLFRALVYSFSGISIVPSSKIDARTIDQLISSIFVNLNLQLTDQLKKDYLNREATFQAGVSGSPFEKCLESIVGLIATTLVRPRSNNRMMLTTYYRAHDVGFREEDSISLEVTEGRSTYNLRLPPQAPAPSRLRIDPMNQEGWFSVERIVIRNAKSCTLWTWEPGEDGADFIGVASFVNHRYPKGDFKFALDCDPQIVLEIPEIVAGDIGPDCEIAITLLIGVPPERSDQATEGAYVNGKLIALENQIAEEKLELDRRASSVSSAEEYVVSQVASVAKRESLVTEAESRLAERELRHAAKLMRHDELAALVAAQELVIVGANKQESQLRRCLADMGAELTLLRHNARSRRWLIRQIYELTVRRSQQVDDSEI